MTRSTRWPRPAEPGEDDLGALSSWYVWAALGLYPETPGVADLVMTSPLFPRARVMEGNGHSITLIGTHAPEPFIQAGSPDARLRSLAGLGQTVDPGLRPGGECDALG